MNKIIYKYRIYCLGHQHKTVLNVPKHSKLLHIEEQNNCFFIWFEVDTNEPTEERTFWCMYTGMDFENENIKFVKSIVSNDHFVVHIYEERKDEFISDEEMVL